MKIFLPEQRNISRGVADVRYDEHVVTISCPDWYKRADFNDWRMLCPGPAGWNKFYRDDEYGDVFFPYHGRGHDWEGPDMEELPEDIYLAIGHVLKRAELSGMVRLKPV